MRPMNAEDWGGRLVLDVNEVAALLGVGRSFVYHLINTGQLPIVKLGRLTRIPKAAIEDFVAASSSRRAA